MYVALPEVDGRLNAGVTSFKEPNPRDPDLQFAHTAHRPDPARIRATVARVAAHVALVLSTYPGRDYRMAHAVGLDALASAEAMLEDLATAGHTVTRRPPRPYLARNHPLAAGRLPCRAGPPAAGAAR